MSKTIAIRHVPARSVALPQVAVVRDFVHTMRKAIMVAGLAVTFALLLLALFQITQLAAATSQLASIEADISALSDEHDILKVSAVVTDADPVTFETLQLLGFERTTTVDFIVVSDTRVAQLGTK